MANWKRMAEAFGRAMATRKGLTDGPAAEAVSNSETLKFKSSGKSPEEKAYLHGHESEGPVEHSIAKERGGNYEKNIEDIEDANSEIRLQKDFDKAFEEAADKYGYVKRIEGMEGRELRDDFVDAAEGDEFQQQAREELRSLLDRGMDIGDVLRYANDKYKYRIR